MERVSPILLTPFLHLVLADPDQEPEQQVKEVGFLLTFYVNLFIALAIGGLILLGFVVMTSIMRNILICCKPKVESLEEEAEEAQALNDKREDQAVVAMPEDLMRVRSFRRGEQEGFWIRVKRMCGADTHPETEMEDLSKPT